MNLKKTLLAVAVAFSSLTASAQTYGDYTFKSHWFLQAQAGAQYTLGEAKFTDMIAAPNVQLAVGYQFNPIWAVRLGVNGWESVTGWKDSSVKSMNLPHNTFKYKYLAPAIDVKFNLINAICGWNPERLLGLNIIAGAGANIAWDGLGKDAAANAAASAVCLPHYYEKSQILPVGRMGLDVDFNVSKRISLNIEGMANIINDHYNGKHADNADWYFNVLAGVKVALGPTCTKKEVPAPAPEPAPTPAPKPVVEKPAPAPAKVVEKVEPYRVEVFFALDKDEPTAEEKAKLAGLKAYMDKYPNSKVDICGYADKGTGNPEYNAGIAKRRAVKIAAMLEEEYNIKTNRITINSKGDTVQPFANNDSNRVVIGIAE